MGGGYASSQTAQLVVIVLAGNRAFPAANLVWADPALWRENESPGTRRSRYCPVSVDLVRVSLELAQSARGVSLHLAAPASKTASAREYGP